MPSWHAYSNIGPSVRLNEYSPDTSAEHSGVGYAGNRVQSLVLKRVRLLLDTGDVVEDNTERVVHSQQ